MWRERAPMARGRRLLAALSAVSAVAVLLGAGVTPASARQTFIVNDPTDARDAQPADGVCSSTNSSPTFRSCTLRSAMWEATLTSGAIVLPAGVFRLTIPPGGEATGPGDPFVGDLDVFPGADIRIIGAGVRNTFIDGGNTSRIFDVEVHGTLSLKGVALEVGKADFDGDTGHSHGGAIHNHGMLDLERVAVTSSSSTGPSHTWGGGGITNAPGAHARLLNVTVADNSTDAQGGGIENKGELVLSYSTITHNSAPGPSCVGPHRPPRLLGRGRVALRPPLPCELNHGGGLFLAAGSTTFVSDTIVAENAGGKDCVGPGSVTSLGGNLQGDGSCPFHHPTDRRGDPLFLPGASGPPRYWPLLPNSPAVDVPTTVQCIAGTLGDIRGANRPEDGDGDGVALCDSGSYELQPGALSMLSISNAYIPEGQRGSRKIRFTVTLSASTKHTVKVHATTRDRTARAGFDYVAKTATLVFEPHQRHKTFAVAAVGDRNRERNETFTVHLSVPKGARIADANATGTIINDD
jgi:hypothetical protein